MTTTLCILLFLGQCYIGEINNYNVIIFFYFKLAFSVPLSSFYPYGTSNGDSLFGPNDDSSTYIDLATNFIFYNQSYSRVYVRL